MGVLHLVFAALFALSAGLQYNDPDPVQWALLYLAATALAVGAFRHWPQRPWAFALAAVCVLWMATLVPGMAAFVQRGDPALLTATMKAEDPVIEDAREFLGLGIVLAYSLVAAFRSARA